MRRRLRKKRRLGEFAELGFSVRADLTPGFDEAGFDAFVDRWIEAIEARGVAFGGGGRPEHFGGFVTRPGRGTAADADRDVLSAFLVGDSAVVRRHVGSLVDAWHSIDT
jgi:uncharacterized protein